MRWLLDRLDEIAAMTNNKLASVPPATTGRRDELLTEQLDLVRPPMSDAIALIDDRTNRRGVSAKLAPSGCYLAFEGSSGTLMVSLQAKLWPTRIGRGFAADVRVTDQRVSRSHAVITGRSGSACVLDDRSTNGTFVNGRRVTAAELQDGDVIMLGAVRLRYVEVPGCRTARRVRRSPQGHAETS
jgi:hypothetical protein